MADAPAPTIGDPAPEFTLEDADGRPVSLADFRGKAEVVLYFYPKDSTPGCTAEACAFRDDHEAFRAGGAVVLGVSDDPPESHRHFAGRYELPFPLLSDPGGAVRARYGVRKTFGLLPGRATFLIARDGIIRHAFASQFRPTRHVREALAVLERLRRERAAAGD